MATKTTQKKKRAVPSQFVRMRDGHPVMRCSNCEEEHWTGAEGITTSDGKELCISCQRELQHLYDAEWNLLNDGDSLR